MFKLKDPVSALTHLAGAILSVCGLIVLVAAAVRSGSAWNIAADVVFGVSLILLYTASTVYHSVTATGNASLVLRKLDHIMIFVLIAGTYTPFCLGPLRGIWGWSLFGAIWGLAVAGFALKLLWMQAPRWLSTSLYVLMGWLVVVAIYPLMHAAAGGALLWLLIGGLFYTVGAILYATKWPRLWPPTFGFHELWHLFVMAGSISHFVAVYGLAR